jgi:hypothetical protein
MSKLKFTISFRQTSKDKKIFEAIQEIEEQERSQVIKDILYRELIECKGNNHTEIKKYYDQIMEGKKNE